VPGPDRPDETTAMNSRRSASILCALVLGLLCAAPATGSATDAASPVLVTRLDGTVSPVSANALIAAVDDAERRGAAALLVEVDTPGGLLTSMREIVGRFLNADVPVIAYVAPNGARAASAGTLIVFSANVAAMAPATTIGAATPVTLDGGQVGDKVVNDAASYAEAVAQARGRDTAFARRTVTEGESVTAQQALDVGAIDVIAPNRLTLLAQLDGQRVVTADGNATTLELRGAPVIEWDRPSTTGFLEWLVDPNLTFVLLTLGTLALLVEFANPGIGAGGIVGVILLLLAAYSLALLPTTMAGVALLLLAGGLFIGELFVPGIGVLAAGGAVSLVLAGLFLFEDSTGLAISQPVLIGVAVLALLSSSALAAVVRGTRSRPRRLDDHQLIDSIVEVIVADGEQGQALVNGERWHVRTDDPPLERGMLVRILERHGLTLLVEPEDDDWRYG
jgi:membrane-bound serine protease (ClpP class)